MVWFSSRSRRLPGRRRTSRRPETLAAAVERLAGSAAGLEPLEPKVLLAVDMDVDVPAGEVIDVSAFKPRRIPSKKWRELIKKVWEADPLLCPQCHNEMRIITLIDEAAVIERILRHLGLWEAGVRVDAARDPPEPAEPVIEPWLDDPFPNYENELVFAHN